MKKNNHLNQCQINYQQSDRVLIIGILFSVLLTFVIVLIQPYFHQPLLLPDQGASWYFWKLAELKLWHYLTPWISFVVHLFAFWILLYRAKSKKLSYSQKLHRYNWYALILNIFFVILHFIQTAIWYDGLAQTTPVWSSQAAVAIMMIWVLLMENKRRGLFFGKKVSISESITDFAIKNHGYYFSWAIIYTFWFHPMVNTDGHLAGFFYLFLLLIQSSLFFTTVHRKKGWTFTLEILVLIHGTLVAINQPFDIWPMFAFGFGGIFIITQMHGIGLSSWFRAILLLSYILLAALVYRDRSLYQLNELIRIPFIDYVGVFLLSGIFYLFIKTADTVKRIF